MSAEIWILVAFFGCVMSLVTVGGYLWMRRPVAERAASLDSGPVTSGPPGALLGHVFELLGKTVPTTPAAFRSVRVRLVAAGYRSQATVPVFYGLKTASSLLLTLLLGWGTFLVQQDWSAVLLPAMAAAFFGYEAPDWILSRMIRARGARLRRALPDALDLLVLSVEAGQSLDQATADAAVELRRPCPDLAAELTLLHLELRAGTSRPEALRHLADRNPEAEMRRLSSLLIQADRFGTSLGPTLRTHARYLRLRFKQEAEEAARKISVKLLFPIFFLIFPSMMLVTAGPAVLQILNQLLPMISGQ